MKLVISPQNFCGLYHNLHHQKTADAPKVSVARAQKSKITNELL